jgi:Pyruvate/2-oxoacid:ferredoxin oxidoreductase delta subunit
MQAGSVTAPSGVCSLGRTGFPEPDKEGDKQPSTTEKYPEMSLSRRDLIHKFFKPLKAGGAKTRSILERSRQPEGDRVAVIQGRLCLAYIDGYCSVCYERCPVPGAIQFQDGLPMVVPEACTGCGVCHDVCPAPQNAILFTPRRSPLVH